VQIQQLTDLKQRMQEHLAELCAFIDCPLDWRANVTQEKKLVDPKPLLDLVLGNARGWLALRVAAESGCTTLLGSHKLAPFFARHRRGSLYHQLRENRRDYNGIEFGVTVRVCRSTFFMLVVAANLLLLPIISCILLLSTAIGHVMMLFGADATWSKHPSLWHKSQDRRLYVRASKVTHCKHFPRWAPHQNVTNDVGPRCTGDALLRLQPGPRPACHDQHCKWGRRDPARFDRLRWRGLRCGAACALPARGALP
jgi:hypothetical protein